MMQINYLDHVNIRTRRLDQMRAWYCDILGLTDGPRPDFPFAGAWLYAGDVATVHLVEVDEADLVGSETSLKLEHFAFKASGATAFRTRLDDAGMEYQSSVVESTSIVAFNVWDPDGNHVHVDFALDE